MMVAESIQDIVVGIRDFRVVGSSSHAKFYNAVDDMSPGIWTQPPQPTDDSSGEKRIRLVSYDEEQHSLRKSSYVTFRTGLTLGLNIYSINHDVVSDRKQVYDEIGEDLASTSVTDSPFPLMVGPAISVHLEFGVIPFRRAGIEFGFVSRIGAAGLLNPVSRESSAERVALDEFYASTIYIPAGVYTVVGGRNKRGFVGGLRLEVGLYKVRRSWEASFFDEEGAFIKKSNHEVGGTSMYFKPQIVIPFLLGNADTFFMLGGEIPLAPHSCRCGYGLSLGIAWGSTWGF